MKIAADSREIQGENPVDGDEISNKNDNGDPSSREVYTSIASHALQLILLLSYHDQRFWWLLRPNF